ncbi:efflux RND transporter permease subunit [Magnetovibrio sp. PR-2]|uniref:efflux RND transporter permease subunit n=1 Tax=Magnetovibrio sp. PR-2 TaxID=3120356 RepID=UPI002FCE59D2
MVQTLRQRVEDGFEAFGRWITRRAWIVLILSLAVVGGLASNLPKLVMDTATESFLHDDDPALLAYNDFRDQFGRDELVIVAVETGDIFDPAFLTKFKLLHDELEAKTPYLDDITSLINTRNTFGREDELLVEDLFENWPDDLQRVDEKRKRAADNPLMINTVMSDDNTIATIVIRTDAYSSEGQTMDDALDGFDDFDSPAQAPPAQRKFLTDAENSELVGVVQDVAYAYEADGFKVYVSGSPVVADTLKRNMQTNMKRFTLSGIGVIALVLLVMFRRPSGVVLPILVVVFSLLGTLGLIPLSGRAFTLPMQILPSFLLAVGVGASVHLLAIFFRQVQKGSSTHDSVVYAMGHSGLPIVMTSLTTAAGLASFAGAEVAPIADLGVIASAGIMLSLFLNLTFLPAALSLLPLKAKSSVRANERHERMDKLLTGVAAFSTAKPWLILSVSAIVLTLAFGGITQLRFSHQPFTWIPTSEPSRAGLDFIDQRLKGASTIEVLVDTGETNGLYAPDVMKGLDALGPKVEGLNMDHITIGKTLSLADILKESNKALHANDQAHYAIPDNRDLIAQELFLFENSGSDDMEDFVDSQFQHARFTIKMPWVDSVYLQDLDATLIDTFQETLGDGVKLTVTGMNALLGRTMQATIYSMAESYVIAAGVIGLMMIAFLGNVRYGLVSMIPNLTPIVVTLGMMGWLGVPLDIFTMLIGSIAIGLAVDDTIHFMHNYRRYHHDTGSVEIAVKETLLGTGRAMLVTSVVLALGFFIYMFSIMHNLFNFGWLTGTAIILALLADTFLAAALMRVLDKAHLIPDDKDY